MDVARSDGKIASTGSIHDLAIVIFCGTDFLGQQTIKLKPEANDLNRIDGIICE